ncbi:HesA/MoeB/ThiF family protein [Belliella sp. R4-6]|uniref:HesA/MoeB/ThiF family protein n=1 Tax=Belliella alkalica TaxID=1730871 RepID=A0ABS9VG30_9BACT|nr:HesA/MoeB/ThiF family protein [Belliella alkalica]MCH7414803.1 HesA/MoeB/ThiF family protein [Belliella alkalica]
MDRFDRHYNLKGFGQKSQQKLQDAKVLVVGAGGLGCPVLLYLASVGFGKIGIVDGDLVSESNLSRQVLFGQHDLGKNKAEAAVQILRGKYNDIELVSIPEYLNRENVTEYLHDYDLVVDGSDNFPTRYLVNDACVLLGKPLVFGALYQNEGQVAVFNTSGIQSVNYRDIYPIPPSAHEVPNCNEAGVLGVFPGIIGCMMASEAIKLVSGFGEILDGKMLYYNFLNHSEYKIELTKDPQSEISRPKSANDLMQMDYQDFCGLSSQINWEDVIPLMEEFGDTVLVDLRQPHEEPELEDIPFIRVPMNQIHLKNSELARTNTILLFCQTGIRSMKASKLLQEKYPDKYIRSISGGINSFDLNL